jgi:formate dehydrogenase major subunit
VVNVAIDGVVQEAQPEELLIDLINRKGVSVPHVCYHPQLGPVQTCDTCLVEVNGRLVRACGTVVADGIVYPPSRAIASPNPAYIRDSAATLKTC